MPIALGLLEQLLEQINSKLGTINTTVTSIDQKIAQALDTTLGAWKSYLVQPLPAGDNIIGRIKITDGTNLLTIDSQGRLKSVRYGGYNIVKIMDAVSVGTTEVTSAVVDAREYAGMLIIVQNTQDVDVSVKVDISPDQTNWFEYIYTDSSPLTVAAGTFEILEASRSPAPFLRIRAVAAASPTSGSVSAWAILKQ